MNAIANVFTQLLQQANLRTTDKERQNSANSYDHNLARVWGKLPEKDADYGTFVNPKFGRAAVESMSARMYSLADRVLEDGLYLVNHLGACFDSDSESLNQAKRALSIELKCLGELGFARKSGPDAIYEYVRQLNAHLEKNGSEYRIEVSSALDWCTLSNVHSAPPRYVSFDCSAKASRLAVRSRQ